MGMFSEIATQGTIAEIAKGIGARLETETEPHVRRGLLLALEVALGAFDWDTPDWARAQLQDVREELSRLEP